MRKRYTAEQREQLLAEVRSSSETVEARATQQGRSLATKALGYAINQEHELRRVLDDGRLPLDNTRSERATEDRRGSQELDVLRQRSPRRERCPRFFTIIASCRLHRIEPEQYLDEVLRLLPQWPQARFLELAPKFWKATRDKLDAFELDQPLGPFTIPEA